MGVKSAGKYNLGFSIGKNYYEMHSEKSVLVLYHYCFHQMYCDVDELSNSHKIHQLKIRHKLKNFYPQSMINWSTLMNKRKATSRWWKKNQNKDMCFLRYVKVKQRSKYLDHNDIIQTLINRYLFLLYKKTERVWWTLGGKFSVFEYSDRNTSTGSTLARVRYTFFIEEQEQCETISKNYIEQRFYSYISIEIQNVPLLKYSYLSNDLLKLYWCSLRWTCLNSLLDQLKQKVIRNDGPKMYMKCKIKLINLTWWSIF